ncbi:phosphomannomutase [Candidatus Bathyarchaeota archaeon]|nr:MAG: phosphomannomutase [Candidatus Bathyarchaeota archaeon]
MAGIYRAYDIRGVYGEELTVEEALKIGLAFGSLLEEGLEVMVGRDSRLTGPTLQAALTSGLTAAGCPVVDLGLVATPVVYFASIHYGVKGGAMVTASHNPPQYNGFKLCRGGVSYSYETGVGEIERRVKEGNFRVKSWRETAGSRSFNVLPDYRETVLKGRKLEKPLKVVVDVGNGACGFSEEIFRELGCQVKMLYAEPDGRFPNHIPNPLLEETLEDLKRAVVEWGADMGVAFDGDGDRVGFIDDKGRIVRGDQALILYVREILSRYPGSKIIFNVLCSKAVMEEVEKLGGKPLMTRVGHSYIHEALLEENSPLAGELSGHFYFGREYYGFDDAIYAAVRMAEIVSKAEGSFSQLVDSLPKYVSSPEIRVKCPDEAKFKVVDVLKSRLEAENLKLITVDGVRVEWQDGWGLVRASNTEPALVLRFEASTSQRLEEIKGWILGRLKEVLGEFGVSLDR